MQQFAPWNYLPPPYTTNFVWYPLAIPNTAPLPTVVDVPAASISIPLQAPQVIPRPGGPPRLNRKHKPKNDEEQHIHRKVLNITSEVELFSHFKLPNTKPIRRKKTAPPLVVDVALCEALRKFVVDYEKQEVQMLIPKRQDFEMNTLRLLLQKWQQMQTNTYTKQ